MQTLYDTDAFHIADRCAVEQCGIPMAVLMENAGRGAAEFLMRRFPHTRRVMIFSGPGHNGGDGLVLARHLATAGVAVAVLHTAPEDRCAPGTQHQIQILRRLNIPCRLVGEGPLPIHEIVTADVVVDALLGTGSSGDLRGAVAQLAEILSHFSGPVLSLDIPSGVNASDGTVGKHCIRATHTITFLASKIGLHVAPGAAQCGAVDVLPIGVPAAAVLPPNSGVSLMDPEARIFSPRIWHQHKGSFGTVLVVGGSAQYPGAPLLAARGALRSGAGGVVLAVPEHAHHTGAGSFLPEAIRCPLSGAVLSENHWDTLASWFPRISAVLVGPGLGRHPDTQALVQRLWAEAPIPLVADADALFALAEKTPLRQGVAIITPHEGEASRLLDRPIERIRARRLETIRDLASRWPNVLLKGAWTLVASRTNILCGPEGTPALAVPGSGDVLSGIVATFLAQGWDPVAAGEAACTLHCRSGILWRQDHGDAGMLAEEIADLLPVARKHVMN